MNPGGEPDRDDFGLPPADIVVPDDARELDRDVQAYHREQRALRRRRRRNRWIAPLTRDGMIVPLLAGCLILALVAGTLLTVFTAWPGNFGDQLTRARTPSGRPKSPKPASTQPGNPVTATGPAAAPAGSTAVIAAAPLPDLTLRASRGPLPTRQLASSVLALVPPRCQCAAAVRTLAGQAAATRVRLYLVGDSATMPAVRRLARQAAASPLRTAEDPHDVLGTAYHRAGLTALLVDAAGSVRLARHLGQNLQLTSAMAGLAGAGHSPGAAAGG